MIINKQTNANIESKDVQDIFKYFYLIHNNVSNNLRKKNLENDVVKTTHAKCQ